MPTLELPPKRIVGTETEYAIGVRLKGASEFRQINTFQAGEIVQAIPEGVVSNGASGFLSNGGRFYIDIGDLVEYGTPETEIDKIVTYELAGEQIVTGAVERLKASSPSIEAVDLRRQAANTELPDRKNSDLDTELVPVTFGYHENYLSTLPIEPRALALFGMFLATRHFWAGGGSLVQDFTTGRYHMALSQKALAVTESYSENTTHDKPVVNLRDEPHAKEGLSRIHVTSGDPNVSPWATEMKLGTSSLSLRLSEEGIRIPIAVPLNRLAELNRLTATDLTFSKTFTLDNGKTITPLEIQEMYINACAKLSAFTDYEKRILQQWEEAHTEMTAAKNSFSFDSDEPIPLAGKKNGADWAVKASIFRSYIQRSKANPDVADLSINSEAIRALDKGYVSLAQNSIGRSLRAKRWASKMPPPEAIADAMVNPPETRAKARGELIKKYTEVGNGFAAGWGMSTRFFYSKAEGRNIGHTYRMPDPSDPTMPEKSNYDEGDLYSEL